MPSCDLSDVNSSLGSALTPGSRDDTDMEDGEQEAHDLTCPPSDARNPGLSSSG